MTSNLPIQDLPTADGGSWGGDCRLTRRYLDAASMTDGSVLIEPFERHLASATGRLSA